MDELDERLREFEEEEKEKPVQFKEQMKRVEKLMILGSLVPDLILENLGKKKLSFSAVLLMADVSGFTELCDKYSKNSIRASSQITEIINIYIGEMVKVVYEYKGDVVNYSGDAILALWKKESVDDLSPAIRACDCAVYIQERIGEYVTQVNTLRVKLTITTGDVNYVEVGDEIKKDFILLGEGILDLKKTEKYTGAGQTVVTSSIVNPIMKKRYKFEPLVLDEIWKLIGHKFGVTTNYGKFKQESGVNYLISLRPLLKNITQEDAEVIKPFMMNAVNNAIEMTGRVEQMTEMRNVVVVFINIITSLEAQGSRLSEIIEDCYLIISRTVLKMEGAVNKLSLFDKDLMFLVIFGLRYYKGSVTEKTALKCAKEIKLGLENGTHVSSVSIGVTSGTVYCGVVGHPVRREFTVIGLKVNMAARLMVAYQNIIVCDRETFLHSRIEYKNFVLQEPKYLKGISNVGPIYMYTGQEKDDDLLLRTSTNLPLLGRDKEMYAFEQMLLKAFSQGNPETKNVIAFVGESGQGKTRILEEVRIISQEKCNCLLVELQINSLDTPYSGIQQICRGPLGLTENSTIYERESRLYNLLKGEDYNKDFICMLNRVFNVNFIYTPEYLNSNSKTREMNLRKLIVLIMKKLTVKQTVLIIDNAEYMDKISWLLMYDIIKLNRLVTTLGIGTKAELFPFARNLLKKKRVKIVTVGRIEQEYLIGLACQMLSVDAIPYELLIKIQKDSEGNPGWIEGFLLICIQTGYLYFKDDRPDLLTQEKLVKAPRYMLERGHNIPINKMVGRVTGLSINQSECDTIKACVRGEDFKSEEFPLNRETRVITTFYALEPHIKQILRYCTALGDIFSRDALQHLLENVDEYHLCTAIKLLFEKKILGCATRTHSYEMEHKFVMRKRLLNLYSDDKIECICPLPNEIELKFGPKYAYCEFLRFVSRDFKNAINLLLTHAEKKDFHLKIIRYLHTLDKQCSSCKRHESKWKHFGVDNVIYTEFKQNDLDTPGKLLLGQLEWLNETDKLKKIMVKSCVTRTLRFSYVNLSDCHCHLIGLKFNEQLIYHCLEGEALEPAINSILDNALLYLTFSDVIQAYLLTEKAANHLTNLAKVVKEPYVWKIGCTFGIIYMMRGLCKFSMGQIQESIKLYNAALAEFGYVFPQTNFKISFQTMVQNFKMKHFITHGQSQLGKATFQSTQEKVLETLATESLCFLARSYIVACDWKRSKLAAIWSFNKAFKLGNNFFVLTFALGNVLCLAPKIDSGNFYTNLREFAEKLSSLNAEDATYMEIRGILHLFKALIVLSSAKGELEEAIEYSHIALSISLPVQEFENKLRLIPMMVIMYTLQLDIQAAISKLVEYESIMNTDVDNSSRLWYVGLIMFITLYCGIELMTFSEANSFLEKSGKLMAVKDLESEMTLKSCMWLHSLRRKKWDQTRIWRPTILDEGALKQNSSTMINLIVFEGLLLQFARIDSINRHLDLVKKIINFDNIIADTIDENLMWKPKYLHLIAYRHRLEFANPLSNRNLAQAENLADCQGNKLESLSVTSDRDSWISDISTGHNVQSIEPISWKGSIHGHVTVYNLPIEDHFY